MLKRKFRGEMKQFLLHVMSSEYLCLSFRLMHHYWRKTFITPHSLEMLYLRRVLHRLPSTWTTLSPCPLLRSPPGPRGVGICPQLCSTMNSSVHLTMCQLVGMLVQVMMALLIQTAALHGCLLCTLPHSGHLEQLHLAACSLWGCVNSLEPNFPPYYYYYYSPGFPCNGMLGSGSMCSFLCSVMRVSDQGHLGTVLDPDPARLEWELSCWPSVNGFVRSYKMIFLIYCKMVKCKIVNALCMGNFCTSTFIQIYFYNFNDPSGVFNVLSGTLALLSPVMLKVFSFTPVLTAYWNHCAYTTLACYHGVLRNKCFVPEMPI